MDKAGRTASSSKSYWLDTSAPNASLDSSGALGLNNWYVTNPILTDEQFAAFHARVRERLGDAAEPPAYPAGDGRTKTSAAWLIDKAGFTKGYGSGAAQISTKHTLALTNRGGATTEDLLELAREVVAGVREAFGVTLANEPVTVGVSL